MKIKKQGARIVRTMGIVFVVGILGIVAGIGGFGSSRNASALTYQNDTNILFTFNPAITLSISGDLSINNLQPNSASDSNIITVTAGSNTPTGYTLYTNVGDSTNNYTDLRLSSSDTTNIFSTLTTGVSSLNSIGDSKWGYSYCNKTSNASACNTTSNWVYGSTGGTSIGYGGMPLYNDTSHNNDIVLVNTNNPDSTTLDFKIGAKASSTQMAGTYTNVINFINVSKVVTTNYTLNYLDQSGTTTSGTLPTATTGTTSDGTFNITTSRPTNTNADYVFKGWCTADNQSDVTTCPSGGAIIYPGNLYVIASTSATWTGNVYAVWNSNYEEKTIANSTTMQEVNSCPDSLPTGQIYTIKDSRDNTEYHTAKLADGNCWLLDNLALDLTNSTILNGMNGSNTHASNTTLGYLKGTTTRDPSTDPDGQYATAGVANWTSSHSYSAPLVNMTNKDVIPTSYYGTDDPMKNAVVVGNWKVGGYYNYCAASAGSYCYGNGTSSGTPSGNATEDICPKGWRMPTVNSGEYQTLYSNTNYNTYDKYREALRLPLSGYFDYGSADYQGSDSCWWSSTREDNYYMNSLSVNTSSIYTAYVVSRNNGSSVRCVLGS